MGEHGLSALEELSCGPRATGGPHAGGERGSEPARPMCSSAPHAAQLHIASPWRGLVQNNLWVRREGDAPVS